MGCLLHFIYERKIQAKWSSIGQRIDTRHDFQLQSTKIRRMVQFGLCI